MSLSIYLSQYIPCCCAISGVISLDGCSPQKYHNISLSLSIAHRLIPTTTVSDIKMIGSKLGFILMS